MVPRIHRSTSMFGRQTFHRSQNLPIHVLDASEAAYATAVYICHEYSESSVTARLIESKTRLSPLKATSIPRLELMGAVTGLRLTIQISSVSEILMPQATFWVDSISVAFWIHGQSRNYKPFVSHCVGENHEKSNPNQWRYVPTKQNPADHGTRGLTLSELATLTCGGTVRAFWCSLVIGLSKDPPHQWECGQK